MWNPATPNAAQGIMAMVECLNILKSAEGTICTGREMTRDDAEAWAAHMVNEDGTTGGHWSEYQTTPLAAAFGISPDHVSDAEWNVTMNMMYSDYCMVASKYGVNNAEFFADMARAFLFDKDAEGPGEKLAAYYHSVVKG